jgi:hemerythrin-like metal-binding protein
MALFKWDEIYRVGIASIDEQHQRLFEIANRLDDAWRKHHDHAALCVIFGELLDYTVYHFADEERHMAALGYPDLARHRGYHEKLARLVRGYQERLAAREPGIEPRILEFIRMWLNAHVLGTDKEIAAYVSSPRRRPLASVSAGDDTDPGRSGL